ncbi:KH domain-containing protein [Striga asiatica]|uniref:KH domain-containing protein n=1 Tax=Striga asiatica TaxID=4170 RepID=A0A5A7R468_STRAF|nr:KH domain-containing protein [Striga asiatica]
MAKFVACLIIAICTLQISKSYQCDDSPAPAPAPDTDCSSMLKSWETETNESWLRGEITLICTKKSDYGDGRNRSGAKISEEEAAQKRQSTRDGDPRVSPLTPPWRTFQDPPSPSINDLVFPASSANRLVDQVFRSFQFYHAPVVCLWSCFGYENEHRSQHIQALEVPSENIVRGKGSIKDPDKEEKLRGRPDYETFVQSSTESYLSHVIWHLGEQDIVVDT